MATDEELDALEVRVTQMREQLPVCHCECACTNHLMSTKSRTVLRCLACRAGVHAGLLPKEATT